MFASLRDLGTLASLGDPGTFASVGKFGAAKLWYVYKAQMCIYILNRMHPSFAFWEPGDIVIT